MFIVVDWKKRYEELAKLTQTVFNAKLTEASWRYPQILDHIEETDRLHLAEGNKRRILRLTKDVTVDVEYQSGPVKRDYKAGTYVDSTIRGNIASVYLDDDGDGNIYFPADALEELIVDQEEITDTNTVWQG